MQVATPKKGYKFAKWYFGKEIEIPEEWEFGSLKNKIKILSGFAFKSEFFDKKNGLPLIRIRDLPKNSTEIFYNGNYSNEYLIQKGDLLVGMDGEFKPYVWEGKKSLLNQRVSKITTEANGKLDQLFLYYGFRKGLEHYELVNTGTTVGHISRYDIEEITIPLPPLPEQQQIVSIISNVDDTIQKTDKIIEQTQRLKKGMMQKLLTRGIGHNKFKKVKWLFGKEIEIPEDWEVVRINQLIKNKKDIRTGPFGSSLKKDVYTPSGFKIYGQENVIPDNFDIGNYYISAEKFDKMKQYEIKSEDILISLVGTHSKISLVPDNIERGIINPRLLKITFDKSKIFPQFMKIFLNSHLISEQIIRFSHGSTMDILNTEIIKQLNFLLIKHEEQQKIASILSNIDTQLQKEKLHKSNLERLKKGLMQKLLTGQIRVKVK